MKLSFLRNTNSSVILLFFFFQRESGLTQEINDLVKRKIAVDEENDFLRKEFSDLQKKFKEKSQEVKVC